MTSKYLRVNGLYKRDSLLFARLARVFDNKLLLFFFNLQMMNIKTYLVYVSLGSLGNNFCDPFSILDLPYYMVL